MTIVPRGATQCLVEGEPAGPSALQSASIQTVHRTEFQALPEWAAGCFLLLKFSVPMRALFQHSLARELYPSAQHPSSRNLNGSQLHRAQPIPSPHPTPRALHTAQLSQAGLPSGAIHQARSQQMFSCCTPGATVHLWRLPRLGSELGEKVCRERNLTCTGF